jgi:hypothetical protein
MKCGFSAPDGAGFAIQEPLTTEEKVIMDLSLSTMLVRVKTQLFFMPAVFTLALVAAYPVSAQNTFPNAGNVGIGTLAPNHELVVQGNDPALQIRDDVSDNSVNAARLELLERAGGNFNAGAFLWWDGQSNRFFIGTKESGTNTNVLVIDRGSNNVGIGTQNLDNSSFKLSVNGKIRAKEIVVETGWSDYVFDDAYKLMPLEKLETFIQSHRHLPDIPSASEIAENGASLGEMQSRLLQKVEELTLHLIAMKKDVAQLQEENERLRHTLTSSQNINVSVREKE